MFKMRKQIEDKMRSIEKHQQKLPEGKLICSRSGKYYKWECSDGKKKTYIPKKDRKFAEKLAAKKYLSALWSDLNHEKYAIDLYLRRHSNYNSEVEQLLMGSPEVEKLLSPYFSLYTFLYILNKKASILAICTIVLKVTSKTKHLMMGENCVISGSIHIVFQSERYTK